MADILEESFAITKVFMAVEAVSDEGIPATRRLKKVIAKARVFVCWLKDIQPHTASIGTIDDGHCWIGATSWWALWNWH